MKQRFSPLVSCIVTLTLIASVIAGALSVTFNFAKAAVSSDELVLREVINSGRENFTGSNLTLFESIISTYIEPQFDNNNYLICVCCPTTTFDPDVWHMTIYRGYEGGNLWYMNSSGYFSNYKSGALYAYTDVWQVADVLCNVNESYYTVGMPSGNGNWESYINNLPKFYFNGSGGLAAPCGQTFTSSSCGVWMNRDIRKLYDDYGVLHSANMILDIPMIEFDIKVFWLGERKYITTVNQQIAYQSDPDKMFYVFEMGDSIEESHTRLLLSYNSSSNSRGITLLPGGSSFVSGLTNISPEGVYAWDITDIDWDTISYFTLFEYPSTDVSGYAVNCPYYLNEAAPEPGSGGTPDSYTQLWNEYYTYVNNYNTTPVIPDQLSTALFGVNGLQSYPVSIATPHQSLNTYKWWTLQDNLGINFDIMDVVLVHAGSSQYTLVYYYDHSLSVAFMPVQNLYLNELFDKFDCVIIVPDDQGELDTSSWWQSVLTYLADELGLSFDFTVSSNFAVSGSSSGGVEYVSSRPSNATVVLDGYIYVTLKGVQRQQLYNFSDGITKFYKLMSDYVDSEDNWKASFLQFTAAWFDSVNTLNGSLSKILSEIESLHFDINSKLDKLIQNTSEEESNFWYEPLFWFVDQFKPAVSDFTNSIDVIDTSWDTMPLLPELSPVPTIPLIGGG